MRTLFVVLLLLVPAGSPAADRIDYLRDVKPILTKNCSSCHGAAKQRASLRLDTAVAARTGGNSGAAVVPGKSAHSPLFLAVTGSTKDFRLMPPKEPRLSAREIALLKQWIDEGAKAPADEIASTTSDRGKHWAFQAPRRPTLPALKHAGWARNAIDRFILARLEKEGIKPSAEADRVTLIRRVSLDLTGLPPTLAEVAAFVNDRAPDAYEKVVDRLLASPAHGERWGRHWLDLARYADSNGFNIDNPRSIWPYRDWVIGALNRDLPFDQFTVEQLAGDLLPRASREQRVATGFHRNTLLNQEGGIDTEQFRVEYVVDRVSTTGSVFLGLTIGCAQCHDHKFDPLSQREFYQFFAFFNSVEEPTLELPTPAQARKKKEVLDRVAVLEQLRKAADPTTPASLRRWEENLRPEDKRLLREEIWAILDLAPESRGRKEREQLMEVHRQCDMARHVVGGLAFEPGFLRAANLGLLSFRHSIDKKIAAEKKKLPPIPTTLVIRERKEQRPTHIHLGGDFLRKGAAVAPAVPAVMHPMPEGKNRNRLDLARWLVDPKNPLTARVAVNRYWQRYFGAGLVETENDFGTQGTKPTHPELLDWLATEFIERQWSMKSLHRLIVTSATYRQSSLARPDLATVDPRNKLLARQSRLRLEAEIVRDNALAASGLLTRKLGGPSVFPPQPEGVYAFTQIKRSWKASTGPDRSRRGMYTHFWRSAPHPWLTIFDAPESTTTCTRRNRANTPLQALTLLNDEAALEFAQALALRGLKECADDDAARLAYLFRLCVGRAPTAKEQTRLEQFLAAQFEDFARDGEEARRLAPRGLPRGVAPSRAAAWALVARVLLNLDEFITRE